MRILQFKTTPIALAPDELSKAINKYSDHYSELYSNSTSRLDLFDVLCCHNRVIDIPIPGCMLYHSEPMMVDLYSPYKTKMVVAQYQATLNEFKNCLPVRNVIDWKNNNLYEPTYPTEKIRIAYAPTQLAKIGKWHDKGYVETKKILDNIQKIFSDVEVDIIKGVPLKECLERKKLANIVIDECKTGSYHRSGLEGLSQGKLTICYLSTKVEKMMKNVSGADTLPFHNIPISTLETRLIEIIESGVNKINEEGMRSRKWIETYWKPEDIVQEFINIYEQIK